MTPAEWLVDRGGECTRMFCLPYSFCGTKQQVALWRERVEDRVDYIREIQLVLPSGMISEVPKDWR